MELIELIGNIAVMALFAFIVVLTLMSHVEIKKNDRSVLKAQIRTMGVDTTGRIVYRWLLILTGVSGFLWGVSVASFILLLSAVISERLITYRVCRPNDRLGKFLTKYNW